MRRETTLGPGTLQGGQEGGSHQELGAEEFRLAILQDGEEHGMQANC